MAVICERISLGESLRAICKDTGMPSEAAVRYWVSQDHEGCKAGFEAAREVQAHRFAEELVALCDEQPPLLPDGRVDQGWVTWQKMRSPQLANGRPAGFSPRSMANTWHSKATLLEAVSTSGSTFRNARVHHVQTSRPCGEGVHDGRLVLSRDHGSFRQRQEYRVYHGDSPESLVAAARQGRDSQEPLGGHSEHIPRA
jgi:hypothetical protein